MKYIAGNFDIDSIVFLQNTRTRFLEFRLDQQNQTKI